MDAAAFRQSFEDLRNGPRFMGGAQPAPVPAPQPYYAPPPAPAVPLALAGGAGEINWTMIVLGGLVLALVMYLAYKEFFLVKDKDEEAPAKSKKGKQTRRVKFEDDESPPPEYDEEAAYQQQQFHQQMLLAQQQQLAMKQQQPQQPQGVTGQIHMIQAAMEKAKQEAAMRLQQSLDSNEDGIPMPGSMPQHQAAAPLPSDFEPI